MLNYKAQSVSGETPTMADAYALELLVREKLGDKQTQINVKVDKFDSGGANYTSSLFKILVSQSGHDDLHLFAKVASFSESMRSKINADWIYNNEQFVYTTVVKIYEELQESHGVPQEYRFVFPKYFGHSSEHGREAIVTDDLAFQGYKSYDRFASMDWEYASKSVETLAKFHALSLVFAHEQPEEFEKIAAGMSYGMIVNDDEATKEVYVKMVESSIAVLDADSGDRVRRVIYSEDIMKYNNKPVRQVVLAHGDFRLSNLLYNKKEGELHVRAVDYQMMHAGCAPADLMYFISLGSDKQFREKYFNKLIDHYRKQLGLAISRYALDIEDVYPKETFDKELAEIMPQVVLFGTIVLPSVIADEEDVPKADSDFDFLTRTLIPNELYKQRFNELIEDCKDWGVI